MMNSSSVNVDEIEESRIEYIQFSQICDYHLVNKSKYFTYINNLLKDPRPPNFYYEFCRKSYIVLESKDKDINQQILIIFPRLTKKFKILPCWKVYFKDAPAIHVSIIISYCPENGYLRLTYNKPLPYHPHETPTPTSSSCIYQWCEQIQTDTNTCANSKKSSKSE